MIVKLTVECDICGVREDVELAAGSYRYEETAARVLGEFGWARDIAGFTDICPAHPRPRAVWLAARRQGIGSSDIAAIGTEGEGGGGGGQ